MPMIEDPPETPEEMKMIQEGLQKYWASTGPPPERKTPEVQRPPRQAPKIRKKFMFGLFAKKTKQLTGSELAEEGLKQIAIAIKDGSISLEQGRIFDDLYVHADHPLGVQRFAYVMFSPSVKNQVVARCVIVFDRSREGTPSFQIDWAVLPDYRNKNWGTTIATKSLTEFVSGMKKGLPAGFYIEAIVDEQNEASKKIARSLLGGEEVLFNKQTKLNVHNFLKKFPEALPKHIGGDNVAEIQVGAVEIIFALIREQGASVSRDNLLKLVENVSANIGDRDICKAGSKLLAISALSNVTGYSIDQGDIQMANVYANCVGTAFDKYVKGQKESFTDYQNSALQTIMKEHMPLLKELMQCNTQANETAQTDIKHPHLEDIVNRKSNSGYIFYDMDKDLASSAYNWQNATPELLMAYGYARRTISGALLIQGVGDKDNYQQTVSLFKSIQIQTGHTVEFQKEAAHAAETFMATYDPRINKEVIGSIVGLANAFKPFSALVRMEDHIFLSSLISRES